jgi:hypothetical protein
VVPYEVGNLGRQTINLTLFLRSRVAEKSVGGAPRGKYAKRHEKGTNLFLLEPEVAKYFPTAKAVNRALRRLISEGKIDLPHEELK